MKLSKGFNKVIAFGLIVGLDYLAVVATIWLSYYERTIVADILDRAPFWLPTAYVYLLLPIIYVFIHQIRGVYKWQLPYWKKAYQVVIADTYYLGIILLILYLSHRAGETSRMFFIFFAINVYILSLLAAYIARYLVKKFDFMRSKAIIIGDYESSVILRDIYKASRSHRIRIIGYVDLKRCPCDSETGTDVLVAAGAEVNTIRCLGTFNNIESILRETGVEQVLIALPKMDQISLRQDIVHRVQPYVEYVYFATSVGKLAVSNLEINLLEDGRVVVFSIKNNLCNPLNRGLKHCFDVLSSVIGGLLISPILLAISLWVYIDSPGPVLFKQERIGRNGRRFNCYKFRSMSRDAKERLEQLLATDEKARAEWEATQKLKHDPRITKSGAFLRATSLDELPQLWNVICGDMSLVGPRPIVQAEIEKYDSFIEDYYLTRPGITGLWQTSGRSDVSYEERVQMDSWYVRNWSLWLDIVLIFKTIKAVLCRTGAY